MLTNLTKLSLLVTYVAPTELKFNGQRVNLEITQNDFKAISICIGDDECGGDKYSKNQMRAQENQVSIDQDPTDHSSIPIYQNKDEESSSTEDDEWTKDILRELSCDTDYCDCQDYYFKYDTRGWPAGLVMRYHDLNENDCLDFCEFRWFFKYALY